MKLYLFWFLKQFFFGLNFCTNNEILTMFKVSIITNKDFIFWVILKWISSDTIGKIVMHGATAFLANLPSLGTKLFIHVLDLMDLWSNRGFSIL